MSATRAIAIGCLLALALAALSGCGAARGAAPSKTIVQRQMLDRLTIAIERPERPALLAEQPIIVTLTGPGGAAIDGAEVWLALIMPTMRMSPNEPDAAPLGGGRYRAAVIFTMTGAWNVEVHATVQDREHAATFRVAVPGPDGNT